MVALAWANRLPILPHLDRSGADRRLTATVLAELALLVVVGAVAVLTDLRPGRGRPASPPAAQSYRP